MTTLVSSIINAPSLRPRLLFLTSAVLLFVLSSRRTVFAGSATWKSNPISGDWNTAANWTPPTIPNIGNGTLPLGTTFTMINNTSADPIAGTFSNLPDSSTFTINGNTYQARYEGGDGNDLILTVVP